VNVLFARADFVVYILKRKYSEHNGFLMVRYNTRCFFLQWY